MERENGYYWVKPAKLSYGDKWVIATFENGCSGFTEQEKPIQINL